MEAQPQTPRQQFDSLTDQHKITYLMNKLEWLETRIDSADGAITGLAHDVAGNIERITKVETSAWQKFKASFSLV